MQTPTTQTLLPRASAPLTSPEMVPDHVLREFARPQPHHAMGELTAVETAMLCMWLNDMAAELLAHRLAGTA